MEVQELKFLLDLLGFPDYRAAITQIKPNPKTKAAERDSLCRTLCDRQLVGYAEEILSLFDFSGRKVAAATRPHPLADRRGRSGYPNRLC